MIRLLLHATETLSKQLGQGPLGQVEVTTENASEIAQALSEFVENKEGIQSARQLRMIGTVLVNKDNAVAFFGERLRVLLRDQGARHDLVDAVYSLKGQDDLLLIVRRVEALGKFLDSDDGKNLLAGTKRAQNILRIEEKKDGKSYDGAVNASLLKEPAEKALAGAIAIAKRDAAAAVEQEDFTAAMAALAKLRAPVDTFFDSVKVNDDDIKVRENRLRLLSDIRAATRTVADFSKIEG